MSQTQNVICLAAYCAADAEAHVALFDALAAAARRGGLEAVLRDTLDTLDVPRLIRRLARPARAQPLVWAELAWDGGILRWRGAPIGGMRTLCKPSLPTEWQARIAYDSFITRFLRHLQAHHKVAVLAEDETHVRLFIPAAQPFDLAEAWKAFVQKAFSAEALLQTFVLMLNSGKLAGRGFSVIDVPLVSDSQRVTLAALYLAAVQHVERRLRNREHRIQIAQAALADPALPDKQRQKAKRQLKRDLEQQEKEITKYSTKFNKAAAKELPEGLAFETPFAFIEAHRRQYPKRYRTIAEIARAYTNTARSQINSSRGDILARCIIELVRLVEQEGELFQIPSLLAEQPPEGLARPAGDDNQGFCFSCGQALKPEETAWEGRRLVLASPDQRLQSGTRQKRPPICGTCAALAFTSPVKLTEDNLIILLRESEDGAYLYEDHLRMLALGELNIVAGKYLSVRCTEKIGNKLFIDTLGGEQYALYKVPLTFPADVLARYRAEAILGEALLELPARHLVWLRGLIDVFNLNPSAASQTKDRFVVLGQAIRYVQKEEVIYAIYTLANVFAAGRRYSAAQASQLEALRADHVRRLQMEERPEVSKFRDVAALTGMLVAFANYVRREAPGLGKDAEREVEKLLEKVDNPNHFTYEAAGNLPGTGATLWRSPDNHFIYDEAARLLERLGVDRAERETTGDDQIQLQFYFDDVVKAYTLLFEEDYRTEKARREFTYQLKLSLYSRFPEYLK